MPEENEALLAVYEALGCNVNNTFETSVYCINCVDHASGNDGDIVVC